MSGRADLEVRADRALRRGEVSEALALFEQLASAYPDDAALKTKLDNLRETLQPMELSSAKTRSADRATGMPPSSPEAEGERLLALGDFPGAISAYRRAFTQRPDSVLVQERLAEIFRLARAAPNTSPTDTKLPREQEPMLRALLDRISARRRVRN